MNISSLDILPINAGNCSLRNVESTILTSKPIHSSVFNAEFEPIISKVHYYSTSYRGKCLKHFPFIMFFLTDPGVLDPKLYTSSNTNTLDELPVISHYDSLGNGSKFMLKFDLTYSNMDELLSLNIKEFIMDEVTNNRNNMIFCSSLILLP